MCTKMDDSFMFDQIEHAYDQFEKAYDQLDKTAEVVTAAEAEQAGRAQESFDQAADNLKAQISALEKTLSDDKDAFALSVQRLHSLTVQPRLATVAEEETVRVHDEEPGEGKPAVHSMVRMAGFTGEFLIMLQHMLACTAKDRAHAGFENARKSRQDIESRFTCRV